MPNSLTGTTPSDTYSQLLHISDGPTSTEKVVHSGNGVATAMKLSTDSMSVDNIRLNGNTVEAITGNLIFGANIQFTSPSNARAALEITGAYGEFYDAGTTDQVGSVTDRTAVKWAASAVTPVGVSVVSNSRITLTAAGTYRFNTSLQFANTTNTTRTVDLWFAKNGTNIASSGARITVPAANDGGTNLVAYEVFETVAAGDYIEMYWHPSDVSAVLRYIAPVAGTPGVHPAIPAIPPAIVAVQRVS